MSNLLKILLIFFLASCSSNKFEVLEDIKKISHDRGMVTKTYHVKDFDIFTLEKITDPTKPLRVYIEGDGRAYINKYQPSLDPTPTSRFLINLFTQDNSPNLIYIARPCQYLYSKNCEEKYWTRERFGSQTIAAISEVLDNFAKWNLEIVGYSGGAMIALQLQQKNIQNIRTIAGNLDLEKFTEIHHISKLQTVKIDYQRLARLPQIHFIGAADKIIPLPIFNAYQQKLPSKNCVKMKIIDGATHNKNWQESWSALLAAIPSCI